MTTISAKPNKKEKIEQAKKQGLPVKSSMSVKEIDALINSTLEKGKEGPSFKGEY